MTSTPGAARDLPTLSGFEDVAEEPDMGALLKRRPGSSAPEAKSKPTSGDPEQTSASESAAKAPAKAARSGQKRGGAADPAKKSSSRKADAAVASADKAPQRPAHSDRANKIRSTTVHVPAQLKDQVVAYRGTSELSNGDIVIAAIEHAHPHLGELITPPSRAGGSLFEARTARSVRTTEGLPTPLNVRLFENDFDVLDQLVSQFGAASRGHLITVALADFFAAH